MSLKSSFKEHNSIDLSKKILHLSRTIKQDADLLDLLRWTLRWATCRKAIVENPETRLHRAEKGPILEGGRIIKSRAMNRSYEGVGYWRPKVGSRDFTCSFTPCLNTLNLYQCLIFYIPLPYESMIL